MRASTLRRVVATRAGKIGVAMLVGILGVALLGPLFAPHSPTEPLGAPSLPPGDGLPLGADMLGRDVLSRVLHGGGSVIFIGLSSTLLAYAVGVLVGMFAGYRQGLSDTLLMRAIDVTLAFPPLLVLLLLVGGFQQHVWVLVAGVVIVQAPGVARITRTATLSTSKTAYVEASQARGDSTLTIWRKDVLPNILPTLLADFGIRLAISIVLVASMNFLGLGLKAPASDWGLMIAENKDGIALNLWAVLAPAILLAALTVACNLIGDSYIRAVSAGRDVAAASSREGSAREAAELAVPVGQPAIGEPR